MPAWLDNRHAFHDLEDPVALVAEVIKSNAGKRIGLDMNSYCMPAKRFDHLSGLLPDVTFIDFSDAFRPLRLNKSPREIEVMRRAAAVADETNEMLPSGIAEKITAEPTIRQIIVAQSGAIVMMSVLNAKIRKPRPQIEPPAREMRATFRVSARSTVFRRVAGSLRKRT